MAVCFGQAYTKKLEAFFKRLDESGDGFLASANAPNITKPCAGRAVLLGLLRGETPRHFRGKALIQSCGSSVHTPHDVGSALVC